jgi:predicted amino acid racemase
MGITKAYCADVYIAQKLLDAGFCKIGDSRLKNLKNFQDWRVEKILIRIPMSCEVKELVTYADTALISSVDTARLIDAEAQKQQKLFKLILMMELGDLREGIYGYEALLKAAKTLEQMPAVHLQGIGTNIGCVSGVTPSAENMARLAQIKKRLESDIGRKLEVLSAGSSDVFGFMMREGLPDRINELRIGEATIMGTNGAEEHIAGLAEHCITLDAQVVEVFEPCIFKTS